MLLLIGLSVLRESNFEFGILARSIYIVMLWAVWIFVFIAPEYLIYYALLLLFLGLGLKPFLMKTGLVSVFQSIEAKRIKVHDEKLKKGYCARNVKKIKKRERHIKDMRKKMMPKG